MKRELLNFIAIIGFALLGAAVILGLLTGALFIFPNLSIMGAKAVNERNTQIIYSDAELVKAFDNGKFILESSGTQINIQMSNFGFDKQNTIIVEESATGIAFNSLNRTLIEWTQTLYGEDEELYYRIKILEPSGMVFTQEPTTVFINLPYRTDGKRYDFVLDNKYSPVNFAFTDTTLGEHDALLLNHLVVKSASSVNIPYNKNSSVNDVTIEGNNTNFVCQSVVHGDVVVSGYNNTVNIGHGDSEILEIGGDVKITGNQNKFTGTSARNVEWDANAGSLNMNQDISSLTVQTVSANIVARTVYGPVKMDTVSGNLRVEAITGGMIFNAGKVDAPNGTASVSVNSMVGGVTVKNYGIGGINLSGVNGYVVIDSSRVGGGAINVNFAQNAVEATVKIEGYDGNINVSNINAGNVDIKVRGDQKAAGSANVKAHFNRVGTVSIVTGGYASGHDDLGKVDIELDSKCNGFNLVIFGARSANSSEQYGFHKENMYINQSNTSEGSAVGNSINGGGSGVMKIYTLNTLYLR